MNYLPDLELNRNSFYNALNQYNNLTQIVDQTNTNNVYIGFAIPGTSQSVAGWLIKQVNTTGSIVTTTYAGGNANFTNVWNNRASLTYS